MSATRVQRRKPGILERLRAALRALQGEVMVQAPARHYSPDVCFDHFSLARMPAKEIHKLLTEGL